MSDHYETGFIKLKRGEATERLFRDPYALHVLTIIAYRARYSQEPTLDGLTFGQALIGDFESMGFGKHERKTYRCAVKRLEKWDLIKVLGTSLGTIATLTNSRIFSLVDERKLPKKGHQKGQRLLEEESLWRASTGANEGPTEGHRAATSGPAEGHRGATNQKGQKERTEEREKEESQHHTTAPVSPERVRERSPLFDALATHTGSTPTELVGAPARACGVALAVIKEATPDVTPDEIKRRATNYGTHFRDAALTPSALAKHWAQCREKKPDHRLGHQPIDYLNGPGWGEEQK